MFGIVGSGVLLFIAVILRITLGSLTEKFEFLGNWLKYFNYTIIALAIITVIFIIATIIKTIKK